MSFRWVIPLLDRGNSTTLNEADVWSLSPTLQARPLHIKFSRSSGKLLKRIWQANSLDIIMDFVLTLVSVVFTYAGPFFLKRILDALDVSEGSPEKKASAFVYAFLAFASSLCKVHGKMITLGTTIHMVYAGPGGRSTPVARSPCLYPYTAGVDDLHLRQGAQEKRLLGGC